MTSRLTNRSFHPLNYQWMSLGTYQSAQPDDIASCLSSLWRLVSGHSSQKNTITRTSLYMYLAILMFISMHLITVKQMEMEIYWSINLTNATPEVTIPTLNDIRTVFGLHMLHSVQLVILQYIIMLYPRY